MTAVEERRFLQLLAQKLAAEFGGEVPERLPVLLQECKKEMHGMPKDFPQSNPKGDRKTHLSSSDTNPLAQPWVTQATDADHGLGAWASSLTIPPQSYESHLDMDPPIQAQAQQPSTPYGPWEEWPDASPILEYNIGELNQYPKIEEQAKTDDEDDNKKARLIVKGCSVGLWELHLSIDDDSMFKDFVQFPPEQQPWDGG